MKQAESSDQSHAMTDLMAGVAAIFLLLAVVFIALAATRQKQAAQKVEEWEGVRDAVPVS